MEEAIAKWQAAEKLNPAATDPYVEWGNVLYSQGDHTEALKKHRKALSLNPNGSFLHGNVARDLMELGKLDEASTEFQEALRLNPAAWGDLSIWGTLRARQGRMEEAIAKRSEERRVGKECRS